MAAASGGGGAVGVEGGVSGQLLGAAEELPEPSPLSVLLALTDASGSTLRVEHDPSDGRAYLTVSFDGVEAPFELGAASAYHITTALRDWLWGPGGAAASRREREGGDGNGAVKRTATARETGTT